MAVYGRPDIVTDGLVLHLDAGNNQSCSGGGTMRWRIGLIRVYNTI
jgi:hypothetical protein